MRRLLIACFCVLATAVFMATYAQDDDGVEIRDRYTRVEPGEVSMHPDNFVGKALEIKDRFSRNVAWARVPRGAAQFEVAPETHIVFRTSPGTGSNMLCFLPRRDEGAMEVVEGLVEESPITIVGELVGRTGNESIFIVNRLFRGHVEPSPVEKMRLRVTFRDPESGEEINYTIPELERFFTLRLPENNRPVHVKIELR